jgi:hypothetical protein
MTVRDKQLIPTAFQLAGRELTSTELVKAVKTKLSQSSFVDPAIAAVCSGILDQSVKGKSSFPLPTSKLSEKELKIIYKDFGEISGAAYMLNNSSSPMDYVEFPTGNEKLIDYTLTDKNKVKHRVSAKAGAGGKPSIVSILPIIKEMVSNGIDNKFQKATWVLFHLGQEIKGSPELYVGPLRTAEYLDTPGYKALIKLLKNKNLKTGYVQGIPTEKHLEVAVSNMGDYNSFMSITKEYYDAAGYTQNITPKSVFTAKSILAPQYSRKRYGLLHYPITAELVKWLNTDSNHAKELLTKAANTLSINQIYLDKKATGLEYTVHAFSSAEFTFASPSSTPYPVNNRIGFLMTKTPKKVTKLPT